MNLFFSSLNQGGVGGDIAMPVAQDDYDIYIVAGQSNTGGRNDFTVTPYFLAAEHVVPNIKKWNYSLNQFGDWDLDDAGAWGYTCVALNSIRNHTGRNTLIIELAPGGTAIAIGITNKGCWNADFAKIPAGEDKLTEFLSNGILSVKTYLDSINKTYTLRSIIWHQGEADELTVYAQDAYYQNFKDVIAHIRAISSEPSLPVIYGMIPDASAYYNLTIRNAQIQIAAEDNNAYLVDLSDLTLQDAMHFDAASSIEAGKRYADVFINNNL